MYYVLNFFFILSCIVNGFYYLWISLLALLPRIIHYRDERYLQKNDFYFFLLVPCLDEDKVIQATIQNLLSLVTPNTMVIAINDGSTDATSKILHGIKSPQLRVLNRVLPEARQGKGMALNDGYEIVRNIVDELRIDHSKAIIGVMDADTFIKPDLLNKVAVIMSKEPRVGMVQSRIRIGVSTRYHFLPAMQDLEFFTVINRMQNMREYTGTVAAAGNGQFNRLSAMETLGHTPWSSCLLEDFDFSIRMLLKGWKTRLIQDEHTCQQGVVGYKKFIKQRTRWAQGCIQCFSYLGDILKSKHLSISGKVEAISFLLLPWFTLMSSITLLFSWFLIVMTYLFRSSDLLFLLSPFPTYELAGLYAVILVMVFLPGIYFSISHGRETKEDMIRALLIGFVVPVYYMVQIPAVFIAVVRHIIGNHNWVKTDREDG